MSMDQYLYLLSILLFTGVPLLIIVALTRKKVLGYLKILILENLVFIVAGCIANSIALVWGAWIFGSRYNLNFSIFGTELETYLYVIFTVTMIAIFTLALAEKEDKGSS